jgi:pimeloyl-ACP methyl ester carboxylesterase
LKDSGRVAQLAEQCPFKAWVDGSSPSALTIISKDFSSLQDFQTHSELAAVIDIPIRIAPEPSTLKRSIQKRWRSVASGGKGVSMKRSLNLVTILAAFSMFLVFGTPSSAYAQSSKIASYDSSILGVKIHYMMAGRGPTVVLLHGYAETSRMWLPIMPVLAQRFTVIAPDLPGIGDSGIPGDGLDMKSAAIRMHELTRSLGITKASVVGHDIGLMVAYAYAAQFPAEVEKLVVMDAFLPGVPGWEGVYNNPDLWHFRFHGATPELLVQGRERIYFDYYWNEFAADRTRSLSEADRQAYAAAYSRPGRMRAGWGYFDSFLQAAKDFAQLSQTKLTMPVLSIGGDKSLGVVLGEQMKLVATNVTVVVVKNAGHWIMEENPQETMDALVKFL